MTSTAEPTLHHATHTAVIAAPASQVFEIIADAQRWPHIFRPTVHVRAEPLGAGRERLHLWAFGAGAVRNWTSRRTLDSTTLTIGFHQERCAAPAAALGGQWQLHPRPDGTTLVTLRHHFRAVGDDPDSVALINRAMDDNSTAELGALKEVAELGPRYAERVLSFCDALDVAAPAPQVYDFLYRADRWPQCLPHVARLELDESTAGLQTMVMDTRGTDGGVHTTHSVRVCQPERYEIAYKQTVMPPVMTAHVGRWVVVPVPGGTKVISHHTVVLDPDAIAGLGSPMTLRQARERVRHALGTNSRTTMSLAGGASDRSG